VGNKGGQSLKLPRSIILRGKKNFGALFSQGTTLYGKNVNMRIRIFDSPTPDCKLAFIAAKRLGNAVKRNKMKRRMREAFRIHQHILTDVVDRCGVGVHGAFMAKKCGVSYKYIESDVVSLLENVKQKLLKNHYS